MKSRIVCALLLIVVSLMGCAEEKRFAYGSLEFDLAATFSRVEPVGDDRLAVVVLDRMSGFSMSNLSTRVNKRLKANDRIELLQGETVRFKQIRDAFGSLDFTLGKDVPHMEGDVPLGPTRRGGLFVRVIAHENANPRRGLAAYERRYVIDVKGNRYYDEGAKEFRQLAFPFCSPWKDWDDYVDNYGQPVKVDWLGFCQRLGRGLYEKAVGDAGFVSFADGMSEGETHMVCCPDSAVSWFKNLILVRRVDGKRQILGVARVQDQEVAVVCRYDPEGRLRWLIQRDGNTRIEFDCEFDTEGNLSRHLERRNGGREVSDSSLWFGKRAHVVPEDQLKFVAEVDDCLRPFDDAWTRGAYADLTGTSSVRKPDPMTWNANATTRESWKCIHDALEAAWAQSNAVRRVQGLPSLTSREKRLIHRAELLEKYRRDFEEWRQTGTGEKKTTEEDRLLDLERARLVCLKMVIDVDYLFAKGGGKGAHPERLQDLLSTRSLDKRYTLVEAESELRDVWGRDYRYSYGKKGPKITRTPRPIIVSAGPDGTFETSDDLSSDDLFLLKQFQNK